MKLLICACVLLLNCGGNAGKKERPNVTAGTNLRMEVGGESIIFQRAGFRQVAYTAAGRFVRDVRLYLRVGLDENPCKSAAVLEGSPHVIGRVSRDLGSHRLQDLEDDSFGAFVLKSNRGGIVTTVSTTNGTVSIAKSTETLVEGQIQISEDTFHANGSFSATLCDNAKD